MGESPKRRKSLWDEEPPHSPDYEEWGPSKADNSRQSKNNSGWSYGDGVTGEEELRKETYHYKSMSPDRWGRRSNSHSPDNSRTQSRRYHGRGRSRSRSRERREGRSRSPSRGRDRTGDWSRSRDRDRDRDRDRGTIRGQNRSRSPLNNPKRDPYSSSDRRSGPPVPQVCRNFAVGNCRRGSDCRFFHPDSANNRDRDHSEDSLAERLGSRSERGHISRYADRDMHHVEDEVHRNRSKGTIVCRDFVKGNCRWGASCRFSHDGDSYDKGTRSESDFDPGGQDNQASRSAKSLCKYFAAGKCYKDNCKFSHERNEEVRPSDSHRFDDRNTNWMNGPKWDNEERREHSDLVKTSGWDESSVSKDAAVTVLTDRTNERLGHSFENESRAWGSTVVPQFMNSDRDRGVSPHRGCVGNVSGSLNMSESSGLQNFTNIQEIHPSSQVSVQNIDRTSELVLGHSSNQEASGVMQSGAASQPYGSASSIDGIATLGSNALNDFLNGTHQIGLPGQSFIGMDSEHSGILNGTQQEPNVFLPIPPSTKREAPSTPEMLELKVSQNLSTAVTTEEKVHQMKTSPESMMKTYEEAHLQSAFNSSCPSGMLPSNAISSLLETIYAKTKPSDSLGLITPGNFKMPPDNLSCLDNKEQLIQSSLVDPVPGNNVQTDEVKQQEKTSGEVDGKDKLVPDESNDHQGAMNMHGKEVEEGGGNKDEKVMRLFKNALIEFVKEILKPTWKEGRMSREVHKTVVKKAVDKVTSTIPVDQVPRTQEKIEQYLAFSKPKITKLVQAYVERYLKNEA